MRRMIAILAALATGPAIAQTPEQFDRLTAAVAEMEARSYTFYTSVDERFEPLLAPRPEDPAYAESRACVLKRIHDEGGPEMVKEYIAAAEFIGQSEIVNLIELAYRVPAVMTTDLVYAASEDCGPMSFSTEQMVTQEFLELMDEPEVMRKLMGQ